ncbi:MAG: hypothetical protein U0941_03240 [Planctomycetaceae bacterium]
MRLSFPTQRRHRITVGMIVAFPALLILINGLFPWSPLICSHQDVDFTTGRIRHIRYLFFCQVGDTTKDTWLSREMGGSNTGPDWRRVNTFSPGFGYSPHYRFHGAIHQIDTLEHVDNMVPFDSNARHQVAQTLLTLWRNSDSDFAANEFVAKISQAAVAMHERGVRVFTSSDAPSQ